MKYANKVVLSIALLTLGTGSAFAGDCRNVKQKFYNEGSTRINVKKVEIDGNDGTWTEDIANRIIEAGGDDITNGRRFNKLDSGHAPGYMRVIFDRWEPQNNRWVEKKKKVVGLQECYDGKTYHLHINQNG